MSANTRRNVLALGLVSLLTDASSEMIVPLLPLFLTSVVGGGALALGAIEGVADGVSAVLKLWSGREVDRRGTRLPFVRVGYTLSSVVRPLVALAVSPIHVLLVRMVDRVGKGLRSPARDAILAGSVSKEERGWAFGIHRGMDHAGAVVGPLLAVAALTWLTDDLRVVFALSAVPAALAVAVLWLAVAEVPSAPVDGPVGPDPGRTLWPVLVPIGVFALGNASDTFLLLRAGQETDPRALPLLWMALHLVKSAFSAPGGRLADRLGARRSLLLGWGLYAACYAALAATDDPHWVFAITLIYGIHHGLSEPAEKVLVTEVAGDKRGSAFGAYHAVLGVAAISGNLGFGVVWWAFGPEAAFGSGALLAGIAVAWVALGGSANRPLKA